MPPPHRAEALSNDARLTSVAYIGPKSRTGRPRKTKIGTEVAHVTRDSDTTFKVKRSKVNLQGRGQKISSKSIDDNVSYSANKGKTTSLVVVVVAVS